jgi:hypothetical protein
MGLPTLHRWGGGGGYVERWRYVNMYEAGSLLTFAKEQ